MDQQAKLGGLAAILSAIWLTCSFPMRAQNLSEQYLFAAANEARSARGLPPLRCEEHLVLAARRHASAMAQRQQISHQFPGEEGLAERAGEAGSHFSLVTENVAEASNAALIHDLWMNSAGHRANLLDAHVDAVGISVVQSHGQLYAVEDFARTVPQLSLDQQESIVAETLTKSGLRVSTGNQDARETCSASSGFVGSRRPWFVMRYTTSDVRRLPDELEVRLQTGKYGLAEVGACSAGKQVPFSSYNFAVLLFP